MPTGTAGTAARQHAKQLVHYLRRGFEFDTTGIGSTGTVEIGTIPSGSVIEKVQVRVDTVFNAGTTNPLDVGTSSDEDMLVDSTASDVDLTATGSTFVWRGADETFSSDTTFYVTYAQTGTAATTGAGEVIITYIPDNDH